MSMLEEQQKEVAESSVGPFIGPPKTMFFLGFFAGVALCTTLVLILIVWGIATGKAQALTAGDGTGGAADQVAAQDPTVPADQQPTQQAPAKPVRAADEKNDHILGPKNAKVTLIEYSDFQCPYCTRHYSTLKEIMKAYPNDVRLVFRHYPLSFHEFAQKLAEASECAAEMGGNDKFFQYHDKVFDVMAGGAFTQDQIYSIGKDVGLDAAKFKACVDSGKYTSKVQASLTEGSEFGVNGTPATFVNGKMIEGAVASATLKAEIDAILKK